MSLFSENQKNAWEKAKTFTELSRQVLDQMFRMMGSDAQNEVKNIWAGLSFPITSGGLGSERLNTIRAQAWVKAIKKPGSYFFDPLDFQPELRRISREEKPKDPYDLVRLFYGPIFMTFPFDQILVPYDWETSHGCNIEREFYTKNPHNPTIVIVQKEEFDEVMANANPVSSW